MKRLSVMIDNRRYIRGLIYKIKKKYFDDIEIFEPSWELVNNFDGKNAMSAGSVGTADIDNFHITLYEPFILFNRLHNCKKYNEQLVAHELCHLWIYLKYGEQYRHHSKEFKQKMKPIEESLKIENDDQTYVLTHWLYDLYEEKNIQVTFRK